MIKIIIDDGNKRIEKCWTSTNIVHFPQKDNVQALAKRTYYYSMYSTDYKCKKTERSSLSGMASFNYTPPEHLYGEKYYKTDFPFFNYCEMKEIEEARKLAVSACERTYAIKGGNLSRLRKYMKQFPTPDTIRCDHLPKPMIKCPKGSRSKSAVSMDSRSIWCEMPDGKKHGPFYEYYQSGPSVISIMKKTEMVYKNDKLVGDVIIRYKNGKKAIEINVDSKPPWVINYYENGQKALFSKDRNLKIGKGWDRNGDLIPFVLAAKRVTEDLKKAGIK